MTLSKRLPTVASVDRFPKLLLVDKRNLSAVVETVFDLRVCFVGGLEVTGCVRVRPADVVFEPFIVLKQAAVGLAANGDVTFRLICD
jgi:hypothetical protein